MPSKMGALLERFPEGPDDDLLFSVGAWSSPEDEKPGIGGKI